MKAPGNGVIHSRERRTGKGAFRAVGFSMSCVSNGVQPAQTSEGATIPNPGVDGMNHKAEW